ncbi:hypothetical protein CACET_c06900 [Clostridium aceticum]|uniref:Uncharacterized protein n=1 Tax=Clostridium aceticum TaxID=84022 RepID=A0A0D8IER6_9CLOT|nr:hypothetical protein [Clostridium aceticum]AKL94200.1 hypothetical protein CACET_c06900 [Clostridium aceticum]KJF28462.1 hypothetical protein TZ02_00575 [Clostridium aceticum]
MGSSYIHEFDIHEMFSSTDMQKIFIGASKKNAEEFVVINIVNDERFLQEETKKQLQCLDNLIYFEDLDEAIVLVTRFNKAIYLTEYMDQNVVSIKERLDLAYQYLKKIAMYEDLPNDIKGMLIEEAQVIIKDGNIALNDLLIIGKNSISREDNFQRVSKLVGSVLNTIIFSNTSSNNKQSQDLSKVLELINSLQYATHQYESLSGILKAFNQLDNTSTNHKEDEEAEELPQQDHKYAGRSRKEKQGYTLKKVSVGILLAGLIIVVLVLVGGDKFTSVDNKVEIYYDSEDSDDNTVDHGDEGNSEGQNPFAEGSHSSERLEEYKISNLNPDFIKVDKSIFRSGEYSLKFINSTYDVSKSIYLNHVNLYKNTTFSLWIMADTLEEIRLNFKGYNNSHLISEKFIYHRPKVAGVWEMIYFDVPDGEYNKIKLTLFNTDATVWIDDIKINSYK